MESKMNGQERKNGCGARNLTTHSTEARDSLPLIRQLGCLFGCVRARSIRALDTLRENQRVEHRVMKLSEVSAKLNDNINRRSNNSFNRSGISYIFIVNLDVIR
jgi:hypothetical protein